jgi:protocatechuate 4,5-dioxygenase, alpha chain
LAVDDVISGTLVFTGERSHNGYRLNRMAMSLTDPVNREAFITDEAGYMRDKGLTDTEIAMVRDRDWKAMIEAGGSIYLIIKIAGAIGVPLYAVGAHTAGMTYEQFMAQRQGR